MKDMIKDAMILFLITVISGALLGIVYDVTKDPIAEQQLIAKQEACKNVFEGADSFEVISLDGNLSSENLTTAVKDKGYDVEINEVSIAKDASGNQLGYVLNITDHEGYGGDITFTLGITDEGVINGISFLNISETAGLGMRADEVLRPQFADKKAMEFVVCKTGSATDADIDAISGATITSKAVVNGVNAGVSCFLEQLEKGGR